MNNKLNSITLVSFIVIGGFFGFVNFESGMTEGTNVSGIVYDGSGGPWTITGSPYIVVGNITVPAGDTLTIEPGVIVKFGGFHYLKIDGNLTAIGMESMQINITSNKASPTLGDWYGIWATSTSHVEIKYCNVSYSAFGIYLFPSSNNTIVNNTISYCGNGIYVRESSNNNFIILNKILNNECGILVARSSNNIITHNNILNNREGIQLRGSSNITITNNNFFNNGIYITSDSMEIQDFNSHTIPVDNIVNGKPVYYYKNKSGITIDGISIGELILANCTDFDVKNLQINNTDVGIEVAYSTNISISNNNLSLNNLAGISFYSSSNNKIINNKISNGSWGMEISQSSNSNIIANNNVLSSNTYGIGVGLSSHNNSIVNNNILLNYWIGIAIGLGTNDNSSNNTITGNNISNNNYGIYIGQFWMAIPVNNTVTHNKISNNMYGIYIYIVSDNKIIKNELSNNDYSIYFYTSSNNNITNNSFSNGEYGLFFFEWSNSNVITDNTISNHEYGVYIDFLSSGNRFYHNNFIDNVNQAYDNRSDNYWDDGYPSGGNYWSDFDEAGEGAFNDYNGVNQDILGSDGIVDNGTAGGGGRNPYVIDSDSQDNYPLINPVDISPPTITNLQPPDASITNDVTPTISANYSDPSGINVSSVILKVDGIDITFFVTVTESGVSYIPITALSNGIHMVYLEVKDTVGNLATATWSFTVITTLPPATNLTTKVVNNGNNVELEWDPPSSLALDHFLIYRADSATSFDFSPPYNISTTWPDPLNTTWVDPDTGVTAVDDDFYYIVRAANFDESEISSTSNTAGVWTRTFEPGVSTFSLPLEAFVKNDTEYYCQDMNASYIKWMNTTTHTWIRHDKGDSINNTLLKVGEGYEIGFVGKAVQTKYTFCGMPGVMISYDDDILFSGFDPDSEAKNLTVTVESDGNVTLSWQEPASMEPGDWYEIYYSNSRDGFFKTFGLDYDLACPPIGYGASTTTIAGLGAGDPGARLNFMVVPFNSLGVRGASTYSIGIWTEEYPDVYDTFGIPLKLDMDHTANWFCHNIPDTVGINYYLSSENRWVWHSTVMPQDAYDPVLVMGEGYQISTSGATKFTFIGI